MVVRNRKPLQVMPEFSERLKQLKRKVNAMGEDTSLAKLTGIMGKEAVFEDIEKRVLEELQMNNDFKIIRFDRRKKLE